MALSADLIELSSDYGFKSTPLVTREEMVELENKIEGVVFNDGDTIVRAKTDAFRKLQRITSILRYDRRGDISELIHEVDRESLLYNLTTRELDDLKRRQLL